MKAAPQEQPQAIPAAAQQPPQPPLPAPAQAPPGLPSAAPVPVAPVIVLDPAHGGTDTGARAEAAAEKDIVLQMARTIRAALERQGYRVLMTRNDDSNPSYDDRAAMANAQRDAIFISLHASSTGDAGTVRTYSMRFATPAGGMEGADGSAGIAGPGARPAPAAVLTSWADAQRAYLPNSRHLADLLQNEFSQAFSGSPATAESVPVRALRSVTGPAVAIEISSVSSETPDKLTAAADPLGNAIARAVTAFRQANAGGAH